MCTIKLGKHFTQLFRNLFGVQPCPGLFMHVFVVLEVIFLFS